jgi:hypothetical protein
MIAGKAVISSRGIGGTYSEVMPSQAMPNV